MTPKEIVNWLANKSEKELAAEFTVFLEIMRSKKVKPQKSGVFWVPISR